MKNRIPQPEPTAPAITGELTLNVGGERYVIAIDSSTDGVRVMLGEGLIQCHPQATLFHVAQAATLIAAHTSAEGRGAA